MITDLRTPEILRKFLKLLKFSSSRALSPDMKKRVHRLFHEEIVYYLSVSAVCNRSRLNLSVESSLECLQRRHHKFQSVKSSSTATLRLRLKPQYFKAGLLVLEDLQWN